MFHHNELNQHIVQTKSKRIICLLKPRRDTENFFTSRYYLVGISCRGVSVYPSVRSSQVGVILKQLNVGSRKQRHTIAQGL